MLRAPHIALLALVALAPVRLSAQGEHLARRASASGGTSTSQPANYTLDQVTSYPFPNELAAAAAANRIAWAFNERGRRNIWVAEGPGFEARPLTRYDTDDGQELTSVQLTPDGSRVIYVRGGDHGSNFDDELPVNPLGTPVPVRVEIWSVPFAGGEPRSLGEGAAPLVSPRGDRVVFERDRQLWTVPVDGSAPATRLFTARGNNGSAQWSPDGSRLAFTSNRGGHAFIGVYNGPAAPITWIAPSTSRDGSPRWSPDGTRLAFVRRPGAGGAPQPILEQRHSPWEIWIADATTGEGRRRWRAPETLRGSVPSTHGGTNLHWAAGGGAGGRIVFLSYADGWPHLYSLGETSGEPLLLTPGAFMAEHIRLSPDGRHLVFAANAGATAGDIDRRHVVVVPVDRAEPRVLTPGTGLEWSPVVLGDQRTVAYLGATAQQPPLPKVMPLDGGTARTLAADRIPADFPSARLVTPTPVTFRAPDGVVVYGQLFDAEPPRAGRSGASSSRRPAVVYVHGGPPRQMLLGWHYSDYYANAYAMNQYLASRGYVVLAVNYRLGIGYGYEFHRPPSAGAQGASEYQDIRAAGEYLRALPQVDPARIGIYGGSYGGFLTALALGRDSELFASGVDIHGVHDFTSGTSGAGAALQAAIGGGGRFAPPDRERALEVAWESSPVAHVAGWKSPVLLIHADDDRNVRFSQTVDLVRRLEAQRVPYEELVIVDDTHHWMRHANRVRVDEATAAFFDRTLKGSPRAAIP